MSVRKVLLSIALGLSGAVGYSEPAPVERNASAEEIAGEWVSLPLPESLQPPGHLANPWPAACQWYSYSRDGTLKSIDSMRPPCEELSAAGLVKVMVSIPAVIKWKYDLSPQFQKSLVIVTRSDVQGYAEYWEPHFVVAPFSRAGVDVQAGDLLLYLVDMQAHKVVWIRHLRKLR
jgi:hypothetical protein